MQHTPFLPAIGWFKKISLAIICLLFTAVLLNAQESIYLKNRWTNDYIGFWTNELIKNSGQALYLSSSAKKTLWYIERVDDTWVRLRDKDGFYLNVEKGYIEASKVPPAFFSAQWKFSVIDGYNLIINRWTGVYLHNQKMEQEASAGNPAWYSAQWTMEDKNGNALAAKDFSLNAYTSLLPNQQSYYKLENIKYESTPVFLDINRTKSSELANLADYGGDNSGKAWKFTLVSDGWYKINNLKLGGSKVLAIAKNTDGKYYFVLTDFANYPNQLWRMIQFKDPTFLNYVKEKNLKPEKFSSMYYTLVSKQHHLEAITALSKIDKAPRLLYYGFNLGIYNENPFELNWRVAPVDDIAAIKNIPLSQSEQAALVKESSDRAIQILNEALLKATPIAASPFQPPVGNIKGQPVEVTAGGGFGVLLGGGLSGGREYTQEEWENAMSKAYKIPVIYYNNSNFETPITFSYTDENGQLVSRNYKAVKPGSNSAFYLDPYCTFVTLRVFDNSGFKEVYKSPKFVRVKGVKIYLNGTVNAPTSAVWDY